MTLSERLMVERRWAMEMVVLLPLRRAERAALTRVSDSASRADVAVGGKGDCQLSCFTLCIGGTSEVIWRGWGWGNVLYLHLRLEYRGSSPEL